MTFPALNERLQITLSIGVAIYPQDGTSADGLVMSADQALYCAKNGGRNCVEVSGRAKITGRRIE
jgi:diguanylate cyclase (GGDEF)-like protein